MSRARNAGTALGKAIVETTQLMQENVKKNFLDGLLQEIRPALEKVLKKQREELETQQSEI